MLSEEQLNALERLNEAATKGPWRWNLNLKSKSVQLEGVTGMSETVMDLKRWGTNGAKLRFLRDGLMVDCDNLTKAHPNREHHKHWCADIEHPDAKLIVDARNVLPELLRGYRALMREVESCEETIKICDGFIKSPVTRNPVPYHQQKADAQRLLAALKGEK